MPTIDAFLFDLFSQGCPNTDKGRNCFVKRESSPISGRGGGGGGVHRAIFTLARTIVSSLGSLVGFLSYHNGLQSPFPLDLIPHRTGFIEVHSKQREFLGTVDSRISLPWAWIKPTGCFLPPRLG